MAPQRTVVITGSAPRRIGLKPHPLRAEKFLACNKLRFFSNDLAEPRGLFTESARSATINHNDLDTCKMPPLLLGTERGGLRSGILLRARRGNDANRRCGGDYPRCSRARNPFTM